MPTQTAYRDPRPANGVPASKVQQYESFLNDRLKVDLKKALEQRDVVYTEIAEYSKLLTVIETIQASVPTLEDGKLQTQVDLGCNFFAQAEVPNPQMICVAVGYGFFVELTLVEAADFINVKIPSLEAKSAEFSSTISRIQASIKVVLSGLRELQQLEGLGAPGEDTDRNF